MTRLALLLPLVGLGLVVGQSPEDAPVDRAAPPPAAEAPSADEAAIQELVAEFVRAYNAGDAPALAALFTENARIKGEGEGDVTGRAAIEARFAERFKSAPGQTLAIQTESLRMLGSEAAIEEGTAVVTAPGEDEAITEAARSRYVATYVKTDGKWLQNDIHDFPTADEDVDVKSAHDHLKDLEWLLGDWIDEDDEGEVQTVCEWSEDGSFLLRRFRLRVGDDLVMSGLQRIGWDPRLKQFRSWVFDSEGGFSDGLWSRDGDRWIIKTTGVLKDGGSASATNIITRESGDVFRWASTNRAVGGFVLPDATEVVLVRKPPEPSPAPAHAPVEGPRVKETPQ